MKKYFLLIPMFITEWVFGQNLIVHYTHVNDVDYIYNIPAKLYVHTPSSSSIYEMDLGASYVENKTELNEENTDRLNALKKSNTSLSLYDNNSRSYKYFENLGNSTIEIIDILPKINWEISKETKTIQGILCQKATTSFRGRKWTAWFTTQFSVYAGPVEFQDLPGIPLEIYEDSKIFQIHATKIIQTKDDFKDKFELFYQKEKKVNKKMSLKEYVENFKKAWEAQVQESKSRFSGNPEAKIIRKGYALEYEWE